MEIDYSAFAVVPKRGDLLTGTIAATGFNGLVVTPDQPTKSEIFIDAAELLDYSGDLSVGSPIKAVVKVVEDDDGRMIGSVGAVQRAEQTALAEQLREAREPITVTITDHNRGGYIADFDGMPVFIPHGH